MAAATNYERIDELTAVMRQLHSLYQQWQTAESPAILYETALFDAFDLFFAAWEYGDIPEQYRKMYDVAIATAPEWKRYCELVVDRGETHTPPFDTIKELISAIESELNHPVVEEARPLESPNQLQRQGVTLNQMAVIYGWYTPQKNPDVARVLAALADPTMADANIPNPETAKRRAERAEHDERMARAHGKILEARNREAANTPRTESLAELLQQRVPIAQIARMLGDTTEADIRQRMKAQGLTELGAEETTPVVLTPAGDPVPDVVAREVLSLADGSEGDADDVLPLEDSIALVAAEHPDYTHKEIAEVVGASVQKVTAVLRSLAATS